MQQRANPSQYLEVHVLWVVLMLNQTGEKQQIDWREKDTTLHDVLKNRSNRAYLETEIILKY